MSDYLQKIPARPILESVRSQAPFQKTLWHEYATLLRSADDGAFAAEVQRQRWAALLARLRRVPHYAEIAASGAPLEEWPTLSRSRLKELGDRLLAPGAREGRVFTEKSTGTTGTPVQVLHGLDAKIYEHALDRLLYQNGILGQRVTLAPWRSVLYVSELMDASESRGRALFLNGLGQIKLNLNRCGVEGLKSVLRSRRPQSMSIDAMSLASLTENPGMRDAKGLMPRVIRTSAASLTPQVRARARSLWGAEVFDQYVMTEFYRVGFECELHDGFHCPDPVAIIEILDPDTGRLLPDGEVGEITITGLRNFVQPLVRYRTGDIGAISREPCPCGLRYPKIVRFVGKKIHCFRAPDGKPVYPQFLFNKFVDHPELEQYRVIQEEYYRFTVYLRVAGGPEVEAPVRGRFRDILAQLMGRPVDVAFEPLTEAIRLDRKLTIFETRVS